MMIFPLDEIGSPSFAYRAGPRFHIPFLESSHSIHLESLRGRFEAPDALEESRHFKVETVERSPEETAAEILKHLSRRFALK